MVPFKSTPYLGAAGDLSIIAASPPEAPEVATRLQTHISLLPFLLAP